MGSVAEPGFSNLWQTYAALFVGLASWYFNTLVARAYVAVFAPSGLTLWTLAVAGWCGVFVAHKACEFLFTNYVRRIVFLMFVVVGVSTPTMAYLTGQTSLEEIAAIAEALATIATAYALFLHPDSESYTGQARLA